MKKLMGLITLVMVFGLGWFMNSWIVTDNGSAAVEKSAERKPEYWVAPMDPSYRRDGPGKSPMGMDLVPVYKDDSVDDNAVKINPSVTNSLGVKTAIVKKRKLSQTVNTVGYVEVNEDSIKRIQTYTDGWVKELLVKKSGQKVKKGEALFSIYSPKLVSAQEEYLLALKNRDQSIVDAQRRKLQSLGLSSDQIADLAESKVAMEKVKYYSPTDGFISELNIREGAYVNSSTRIMTIQSLDNVWVVADLFDSQVHWLNVGDPAIAHFTYLRDRKLSGKVDYIYPELDPITLTERVRIVFDNPEFTLKPNMFANIIIHGKQLPESLTVPVDAVIRTGKGDRVILALSGGQFKASAVTVGMESEGYYIVLSGLKEGDKVVTSSQFLIDSETNLTAGLDRITKESKKHKMPAMDHSKMKHMAMSHHHA